MKKLIAIFFALILATGCCAFYGGMRYGESKTSQGFAKNGFEELRDLSPEERQQRLQELGSNTGVFRSERMGARPGSGFAAGEIISKNNESITIKLQDGGSRIVFYSDSAEIGKFTTGTSDDLEIGKSVTINGTANNDGSITAQSIQLRPEISQ